jgi:hypothetical protein
MLTAEAAQYNLVRISKTAPNRSLLRRRGSGNFPRFTKRAASILLSD